MSISTFDSSARGLSDAGAEERLVSSGPNELTQPSRTLLL
jgi:hypothetical protein